jgi:hypothetical protein
MANAINNHLQVSAGAGHHHGKRHQQSPSGESRGWPSPWQTPSTITSGESINCLQVRVAGHHYGKRHQQLPWQMPLTLIRMTKDKKGLAFFKGLLL